jgi:uncharacterized protein YukE
VSVRPAQADAAVANTATYVAACRAVGRPESGLTAEQVRAWYATEQGLNLAALEADSAAVAAAADAADEGLQAAREGLAILAGAWAGGSGSAAVEFVERHCAAAVTVVAGLRDAAEVLNSLRQRLGDLIETKAEAAVRIDDRSAGPRPGWLAGAEAVLSGAPDSAAVQVVSQQIAPWVDEIRSEWVTAMRSSTESVTTAYAESANRLTARGDPRFEMPAPRSTPDHHSPGAAPQPEAPAAAPQPAPAQWAPQSAPAQSVPLVSPTLPDADGGLAALVAALADVLAAAPETGLDVETEPEEADPEESEPVIPEPVEPEPVEPEPEVQTGTGESKESAAQPDPAAEPEPVADADPAQPEQPAPQPQPQPPALETPPPPSPPPLAAESTAADQSPCEIAADELPQVGQ